MVRGDHRAPTPTLVAGMGIAGAAGKWGGWIATGGGAAPSVLVPTPAMVAGGGAGTSDMTDCDSGSTMASQPWLRAGFDG